eukprot:scaffold44544_cov62-Attheya_sp.AAC.1
MEIPIQFQLPAGGNPKDVCIKAPLKFIWCQARDSATCCGDMILLAYVDDCIIIFPKDKNIDDVINLLMMPCKDTRTFDGRVSDLGLKGNIKTKDLLLPALLSKILYTWSSIQSRLLEDKGIILKPDVNMDDPTTAWLLKIWLCNTLLLWLSHYMEIQVTN